MWALRRVIHPMDDVEAAEFLLDKLRHTKNNADFFDAMRGGSGSNNSNNKTTVTRVRKSKTVTKE